MTDQRTGQILDALAGFTATLAPIVGGTVGAGLLGASSIAKAAATALLSRGESVATILAKFRAPPDLKLKWEPGIEDTQNETPSSKALAKNDAEGK